MPIKVLDKQLVARIAAGEVVERPASVVKELVENSLDAGATQITVEAKGGGVTFLRVIDNGSGISPVEVELAFERYATSKIGKLDDLEAIASFGFRGEALPSIAAVADVDMVTAVAGEAMGAYLGLRGGAIAVRKSQGRSAGTTVTVKNLFRSVPARLKFLRSTATENSHIANVVTQYALAFPEVKFTLYTDGRQALVTPGGGRLRDTVAEVYGLETARDMLEVDSAPDTVVKVTGLISSPKVSRASRGYLSLFVNRRWITSRLLSRAVEEAYHGLLMTGRYPVAVLNVWLPPQEVDVNIHPSKSEVKFHQEGAVFSAVQKAVRRTLVSQMPVPEIETKEVPAVSPQRPLPSLWAAGDPGRAASLEVETAIPEASLPLLRVIGQMGNMYIVAEGPDGLYLIDQHAAHERIRFEQIKGQWAGRDIESQGLLPPVSLEVSPGQAAVLGAFYQQLAGFGFQLEPFGDRAYLVRAVPALIFDDWRPVLMEIVDSLAAGSAGDWAEGVAISLACHGAVRAGQPLSDSEMRELVRQLERTAMPRTCPHGRPVMVHLGAEYLKREFGRT